jgi:UDP-N-acetylmuramyl tripeptide synthase
VAVEALRLSNWLSRTLGRGSGTVAGGRVGLALDPGLLVDLTRDRKVALVSGTNGKTTTTALMVAALTGDDGRSVATNVTGANMPAGHAAALAGAPAGDDAVLEVDEGYLGRLVQETRPRVVVLLNLSRDQLDRIAEVRMLADRWRVALSPAIGAGATGRGPVVVANADDPLVVWAAGTAPDVVWVGAGQVWHKDAVGCPACGGVIGFGPGGGWACERCDFARPTRHAWLEGTGTDGTELVTAGDGRHRIDLRLPGWFNAANAAMVAVAAPLMGDTEDDGGGRGAAVSPAAALARMAAVREVAGRFASAERHGRPLRLLLAKNPAGWTAIFDLLDEGGPPVAPTVLSVNARTADGLDTSWLWDVPFERLAGRVVVATGDRRHDLAVRLRYAEVPCSVVADPVEAVDRCLLAPGDGDRSGAGEKTGRIDVLANYTAFAELRCRL